MSCAGTKTHIPRSAFGGEEQIGADAVAWIRGLRKDDQNFTHRSGTEPRHVLLSQGLWEFS